MRRESIKYAGNEVINFVGVVETQVSKYVDIITLDLRKVKGINFTSLYKGVIPKWHVWRGAKDDLVDYTKLKDLGKIEIVLRAHEKLLKSSRINSICKLIKRRITDVRYLYT